MVKPHTSQVHADEILNCIVVHGFKIISKLEMTLTTEQAENFYAEHKGTENFYMRIINAFTAEKCNDIGKAFFEQLVAYMTSGPIIALHLRRDGAILAWRNLIGPTSSENGMFYS
jgi:nucleoside-diphosphate kinase